MHLKRHEAHKQERVQTAPIAWQFFADCTYETKTVIGTEMASGSVIPAVDSAGQVAGSGVHVAAAGENLEGR